MGMNASSASRSRGRHEFNSEINVTPLVDVMLVLLIIFMVTSPMLVAGVNVDLPETSASPVSNQEEPLSIAVDKEGKIYLQEVEISLKHLPFKLKEVTKEKFDTRIFVSGDKNVNYGTVISVMGAINAAGFTKVALITQIAPTNTP